MYGLGQIGIDIARLIAQQPHLELVGAIERDPAKIGGDLGALLGSAQPLRAPIEAEAAPLLRQTRPDLVVIATTSFLQEVYPLICDCLAAGAHVVSTCEELVYPLASHPELAHSLDETARAAGVVVAGIGVNPGYVMDLLPIVLTAPSINIRHISVERAVNASTRRATVQQRIGAGLDRLAFRGWLRQRTTPHVGLLHSLRMISDTLGWQLDRIDESVAPIIAETWQCTPYATVAPGQVAGIHQVARGFMHGHEAVHLEWQTALGLSETYDAIRIDGTPPIDMLIRGGVHGDQAAAAYLMHALATVPTLPPGLRTVLDFPVLHYTAPVEAAAASGG
jgi:4-hydroxy-tetrahydrodipicolinate reductase